MAPNLTPLKNSACPSQMPTCYSPDDFPDAALMSTAMSSSALDRLCHCAANCRSAAVKQEADLMVAKTGVNSASAALKSAERSAGVSPGVCVGVGGAGAATPDVRAASVPDEVVTKLLAANINVTGRGMFCLRLARRTGVNDAVPPPRTSPSSAGCASRSSERSNAVGLNSTAAGFNRKTRGTFGASG